MELCTLGNIDHQQHFTFITWPLFSNKINGTLKLFRNLYNQSKTYISLCLL